MATYNGFSTRNYLSKKTLNCIDIELVKEDLLNHIFTEKGSRFHMPNFGTRIPSLQFEPNDQQTLDIIKMDLKEVFNYDPRVNLLTLNVAALPNNNAILALAELFYVEFGVTDILRLEITSK